MLQYGYLKGAKVKNIQNRKSQQSSSQQKPDEITCSIHFSDSLGGSETKS